MEIGTLNSANALNKEITNITKFLDNIKDEMALSLTCGDSSSITFSDAEESTNEVMALQGRCKNNIVQNMAAYKEELQKLFDNL